ncbi:MAG: HAMP domain-containing sensor histidine kinase [Bdellovibrionota bacterium]
MKKAQDRTSIIEDALSSFEWLSQVGIWAAFSLAGLSFLFWAGLQVSFKILLSFAFLTLCTLPAKKMRLTFVNLRNFVAICAVLIHALVLHVEYGQIPSVLLIVPAFLFVEIISGWTWKILFTTALWSIHVYWSYDFQQIEMPSAQEASSSLLGAIVTLFLIFAFNGLHAFGKKVAIKKLNQLKGQNDFKDQRVHASRLQILGELSAALVHELSNPVTNLQGFFSQIFDSDEMRLNVKNRELFGRIEANLARLRDILLGFRSFSRMEATVKTHFKSSELFKDIEILSRHAFQLHKVELKLAADKDITLSGNRVEIGQVMMNFLLNALASTKNSKERVVLVGSESTPNGYMFFVEDSGEGVPEELREKIFRPFFSTKGDDGSGLGLYISKIIAEHHECKLELKSARVVGHGARFELLFPNSRIILTDDLDQVA